MIYKDKVFLNQKEMDIFLAEIFSNREGVVARLIQREIYTKWSVQVEKFHKQRWDPLCFLGIVRQYPAPAPWETWYANYIQDENNIEELKRLEKYAESREVLSFYEAYSCDRFQASYQIPAERYVRIRNSICRTTLYSINELETWYVSRRY